MSTLIHLPEGSVCWPAAALSGAARDVMHAQTSVHRARAGERRAGTTRWERSYADACAWLEWDWVELAKGTVVQADPLGVRCNVLLLDERQRPMLSSRRRAMLATLVYLLPWQGPVLDRLRGAAPLRRVERDAQRLAA